MIQEFKPGAICNLPEMKIGDRLVGPGCPPFTLMRTGPVGKDSWWAEDKNGRWLWFLESGLVVIGFDPDYEKRLR